MTDLNPDPLIPWWVIEVIWLLLIYFAYRVGRTDGARSGAVDTLQMLEEDGIIRIDKKGDIYSGNRRKIKL